ncbi:WbqC family protein [Agrobacterium vaccinii]|uniref:WbqC family protein n=1 Tax=Agrobacterium vaccinii TaxID=2735528 RepID=UPI001E5A6709|nr:WbqC family protein [Agrobacterium vaccinii]UHS63923.1 WbqC family protein [Agrobacterium vaccinii]
MRVVISQSMYFPWVGLLEQIRLADVFVHYDDVQYSKGSFVNRVQVKRPNGTAWMSVPTENLRLGQKIEEVKILPAAAWVPKHKYVVQESFKGCPHAEDAIELACRVWDQSADNISTVSRLSIIELARYFGLDKQCAFLDARDFGIGGESSKRVFDIVKHLNGTEYITGHGARNYLDHDLFERNGISVRYMDYKKTPYPQHHGEFTPFVTALDLVANCGTDGSHFISSQAIHWREFLGE